MKTVIPNSDTDQFTLAAMTKIEVELSAVNPVFKIFNQHWELWCVVKKSMYVSDPIVDFALASPYGENMGDLRYCGCTSKGDTLKIDQVFDQDGSFRVGVLGQAIINAGQLATEIEERMSASPRVEKDQATVDT